MSKRPVYTSNIRPITTELTGLDGEGRLEAWTSCVAEIGQVRIAVTGEEGTRATICLSMADARKLGRWMRSNARVWRKNPPPAPK